jgi:hypothetical protein
MTTVACPRCGRKLRLPDGVAGQPVQCPACKATFVATAEVEPEAQLGGATSAESREAFSDQPRPAPPNPAPQPEPDPDQAEAARRSGFRGSWPLVREGLGWIMAGQAIELSVWGLGLLVTLPFLLDPQPPTFALLSDWVVDWMWPGHCVRMLVYLAAGVCMVIGLSKCQRYPGPGPARGVASAALVAFVFAYPIRMACPLLGHAFALSEYFHWEESCFLVFLLPHWVAEGLLIRFLYLLSRDWRDEPTLARLRWLLALLVADVLLYLAAATGIVGKLEAIAAALLFANAFSLGLLFWVGTLSLQLAMTALLLRVLVGARAALVQPGASGAPD